VFTLALTLTLTRGGIHLLGSEGWQQVDAVQISSADLEAGHGALNLPAQLNRQLTRTASSVSSALSTMLKRVSTAVEGGYGSLFYVTLKETSPEGDEEWTEQFETRLSAHWVQKPIADAIMTPAMEHYYSSARFARAGFRVPLEKVGLNVNGFDVSYDAAKNTAAAFFVYSDDTPVSVLLSFGSGV